MELNQPRELHECLDVRFTLADCDSPSRCSLRSSTRRCRASSALHGRNAVTADTKREIRYLEVGRDDIIGPGDFGAWADDGR